jgi:hypothetical protein
MNLLKKLWNRIAELKAAGCCDVHDEPTPVEVEQECCGDTFEILCLEAGISQRTIDKANLVQLFNEWYVGPCDRLAVRASIDAFKKSNLVVNAKLARGNFE